MCVCVYVYVCCICVFMCVCMCVLYVLGFCLSVGPYSACTSMLSDVNVMCCGGVQNVRVVHEVLINMVLGDNFEGNYYSHSNFNHVWTD